jgi:hypothetical protein
VTKKRNPFIKITIPSQRKKFKKAKKNTTTKNFKPTQRYQSLEEKE